MVVDTIVTNGEVVTATGRYPTDIAIHNGKILGVGDREALPECEMVVDASDQLVMPGVVDPHVHIDEAPENRAGTYEAETAAAALGGVTTIVDFAFQGRDRANSDPDADLLDGIQHKREKAAEAHVDFGLHGVLHRETEDTLKQVTSAVDAGVTSFKLFMSNYRIGVSNGFILKAFERIADEDAVALVHTEDPAVCDTRTEQLQAAGRGDAVHYPDSRPDYAEAMGAADAARLAAETGVKYYGMHTTCEAAADVLEPFQDECSVRAETCVHYTVHDRSAYETQGNLPKIAPPLREMSDVDALFEHLRNGTLSVVSTDHAVYHEEYKRVENWWDAPLGANSLQVSLPVFHDVAVNERGFSYPSLVRWMCTNPARTFGLPQKGTLEPGTDADLILFDPDASFTVDAATNRSNSTYSIYDGRTVTGVPTKTLLRGEVVASDGEVVAEPGTGEFVERLLPNWEP